MTNGVDPADAHTNKMVGTFLNINRELHGKRASAKEDPEAETEHEIRT